MSKASAKKTKAAPRRKSAKAAYAPPPGWREILRLDVSLDAADEDGKPIAAPIRTAFVRAWQDYLATLKGKQPRALCVALPPAWFQAARQSPEMRGQLIGPDGTLWYGLRVRVEEKLSGNTLVVEEHCPNG